MDAHRDNQTSPDNIHWEYLWWKYLDHQRIASLMNYLRVIPSYVMRKHLAENPMIVMTCWINEIKRGYRTKEAPVYVAIDKSWDDENMTNDLQLLFVAWYLLTSLSIPAVRLIVSSHPAAGSGFRGHRHNVLKHSAGMSKQLIPVFTRIIKWCHEEITVHRRPKLSMWIRASTIRHMSEEVFYYTKVAFIKLI